MGLNCSEWDKSEKLIYLKLLDIGMKGFKLHVLQYCINVLCSMLTVIKMKGVRLAINRMKVEFYRYHDSFFSVVDAFYSIVNSLYSVIHVFL